MVFFWFRPKATFDLTGLVLPLLNFFSSDLRASCDPAGQSFESTCPRGYATFTIYLEALASSDEVVTV